MSEICEREWTDEDVRAWEIESHRQMLAECMHREGESRVYCILNISQQAAKIGTTTNVRRRLQQLQVASPNELWMHAHIRGGRSEEREFHQLYSHLTRLGEWFFDPRYQIVGEFRVLATEEEITGRWLMSSLLSLRRSRA